MYLSMLCNNLLADRLRIVSHGQRFTAQEDNWQARVLGPSLRIIGDPIARRLVYESWTETKRGLPSWRMGRVGADQLDTDLIARVRSVEQLWKQVNARWPVLYSCFSQIRWSAFRIICICDHTGVSMIHTSFRLWDKVFSIGYVIIDYVQIDWISCSENFS